MKTYIKKNIKGFYVKYPTEIDEEVGSTYQDFLDGKYVLLTDDQALFHNDNPRATISQVLNMNMSYPENPMWEDVINFKLKAIENYDTSDNVNSFNVSINGNIFSAWLTPAERSNYRTSVEAAELVGNESISLFINDVLITIPTAAAKIMLAQIQLYADQCYIVTKQHENAILNTSTVEEAQALDITQGYPEKLTFTV